MTSILQSARELLQPNSKQNREELEKLRHAANIGEPVYINTLPKPSPSSTSPTATLLSNQKSNDLHQT